MSFWEINKKHPLPKLDKDINVDILIIGGGLAGLSSLYYLQNEESVCLVEQNEIGKGVTVRSTGKITYLQNTIYSDLVKKRTKEEAEEYFYSQINAMDLLLDIIRKEKIACHLEKVVSAVFASKNKDIKKLKKEAKFLESHQKKVSYESLDLKIPSLFTISVPDTYVFHPGEFLSALRTKLKNKIYENTKVIKIKRKNGKYLCFTDNACITAKKVIVACHYPFFFIPFCLPIKSHIEKSYLIARKVSKNPKISGINVSKPIISTRFYEDKGKVYQICLGSSHKTSMKQDDLKNFLHVKDIFQIKNEDIVACWSNVDVIPDDLLPFIGSITKNMYVATGFNTWGMTNSVLAGKMLSEAVLDKPMPYQHLFLPKRSTFLGLINFFSNLINSMMALLGSKKRNKSWYKSNLIFTKKNGKQVAIYKDKDNKEHIVYTTCPHMGCSLIFNEVEKTWDCPCHSSRYTLDGKLMKGPSTKDIQFKE